MAMTFRFKLLKISDYWAEFDFWWHGKHSMSLKIHRQAPEQMAQEFSEEVYRWYNRTFTAEEYQNIIDMMKYINLGESA